MVNVRWNFARPSFRQPFQHFVELRVIGQSDHELLLQYRANFRGSGEGSLCGGAAGGVLGELAIAERESAAGRRAGGADARDEVRIGVGGRPVVADAVIGRELRLQVEAVQGLPRIGGEELQAPVAVAAADQPEGLV